MVGEFQLIDFDNNKVLGLFPTLGAAQAKVAQLGLTEYEIHLGDQLVDFGTAPGNLTLGQAVLTAAAFVLAILGACSFTLAAAAMIGPLQ